MVIQLLQPMMLWGLLGLLAPIAIHLLHKRSSRVLMVGSLKTFSGGSPVQARSIKPNELWLLLLRCLLLSILVLLLCQPAILHEDRVQKAYLFIAPELAAQTNTDSLRALGYEPHLLQPGLPVLDENALPDSSSFGYWEVFREIEKLENTGDTVWLQFYPWLNRFTGDRPALTKIYKPLPVPAAPAERQLAQLLQINDTQLLASYWQEAEGIWRLQHEEVALADSLKIREAFGRRVSLQQPDTLNVILQHPAGDIREAGLWQIALQMIDSMQPALALQLNMVPETQQPAGDSADVWVWLSKEEPPAAFMKASTARRFVLSEEEGIGWFSEHPKEQHLIRVRKSLLEEQNNRVQLARFVPELAEALVQAGSSRLAPPQVLLAEEQWLPALWQPVQEYYLAAAEEQEGDPLENYLWIALILVFIFERWLSLRK
ncbi:BatA domain-containing protein [Cesiribacter sp. SM1]|uniref:BatA domain-containing protein n=1 Tax=Cesiribacter sp. SM1 TaxID=2861196 RepID=UPI001CD37809|nr:BatA domain-containing protein [Cesiribacter sp. SM1]